MVLKTLDELRTTVVVLNPDGWLDIEQRDDDSWEYLRDRVAADFTKWQTDADEFERQFERVVKALRTDGGKLPEPPSKLK